MRFVCEGKTRFVLPAEVDKLVAYVDGVVDGEERLETTVDESMVNELNSAGAIISDMKSRCRNHGTIETQLEEMEKLLTKVKSEVEKVGLVKQKTQKHLQQMVLHASARAKEVQASTALVAQLDHETEERRELQIERAETSIGQLTVTNPAAASGASAAAASGASTANPVSIGECGRWVNRRDNVEHKDFNKVAGIAGLVVNNLDKAYAAEGRTEWSLLGDGPSQVCPPEVCEQLFGNLLFSISKLKSGSCCHHHATDTGQTVGLGRIDRVHIRPKLQERLRGHLWRQPAAS
jgi:hypothetical protein